MSLRVLILSPLSFRVLLFLLVEKRGFTEGNFGVKTIEALFNLLVGVLSYDLLECCV